MIFHETKLKGAYVVDLEKSEDQRGFFARLFCCREFERLGLQSAMVQANLSYNAKAGTLRGMHFQFPPQGESKLVRCVRGAVWDVIVDLRKESPTFLDHFGVALSATNGRAIYIPENFAHGTQALVNHSELLYMMGNYYSPECTSGLRYNDPVLSIRWPLPVSAITDKDLLWPTVTDLTL